MTSAPPPSRPSHPSLPTPSAARLLLAEQPPHARTARRIDGAWWPRSYDLESELPVLIAELPRAWGQISSVIVNGGPWTASPGRLLVANQEVRLGRSESPRGPETVCLLAPGRGRWDLLVVPPTATEEEAQRLMAAAVEDPEVLAAPEDLADVTTLGDDPTDEAHLPRQNTGEQPTATGNRAGA